jgi:mannose-1-phosphate guanylyltransferase/mannose-6-phosphate isomerase
MIVVPVILSGGAGSRLWPVSRSSHPKPFIRLADGQSLLQKAFLRAAALPGVRDVVTVTNRELMFKTADDYAEVNRAGLGTTYILEPFGRNTAGAVALASIHIASAYGSEAVMLVLPADHLVADASAFAAAAQQAFALAEAGRLVTFGITPEGPETGYGYIEAEGTDVVRFVEKPTLEVAEHYVASGRFLWNAGMFAFTAGTMLALMERHCPEVLSASRAALEAAKRAVGQRTEQIEIGANEFAAVPSISIDYAVLEKAEGVSVVPGAMGWSDIGSWGAISALTAPDAAGNRVEGKALLINSTNTYVQSYDRLVGVVGVDDLIIVDTPDALLIASRGHAQEVKQVFAQLEARGDETATLHRTVHRPWGSYTVLEDSDRFKIKRIEVKPGGRLSLQSHHHRSEHWVVVSGAAQIVRGEEVVFLTTNQSTYIPVGTKHRLENPGILPLVMIEVQSGEYLGEDDIVRYEDVYGRS